MKISVMTYNVLHFADYTHKDRTVNYKAYGDVIAEKNAQIVGLNEVYGKYYDGFNQVENVANTAKYPFWYFAKAINIGTQCQYGNGLISKYDFSKKVYMIPDPKESELNVENLETRCILRADFNIEGKILTVLCTHFGLSIAEQKNAVKLICDITGEIDSPVIIMGDFNLRPDNEILKPIYEIFNDTGDRLDKDNYFTFPSDKPDRKIDYILYKGDIKLLNVKVENDILSDHLPLFAEFDI